MDDTEADGSSLKMMRPECLRVGDTVAVGSFSWGGPSEFPAIFDAGVATLERLGLRVVELPRTRWTAAELEADPAGRAADLNAAFADPSIRGIFASIGGEDSARILPYLDAELIAANPKVLMGYSDTTIQLLFAHQLGMVTFNGPSVMSGLAQVSRFPALEAHIRALLFEPTPTYEYQPYPLWVGTSVDWSTLADPTEIGEQVAHDGWHWVRGDRPATGRLVGGCIEVLEFVKGSQYWPAEDFWNDRLLFLETSEEEPTIEQIRAWLFNYGVQGVFGRINGLLVGRARGYSPKEKEALDRMIMTVVDDFGASDLPIVTNLDFGHTDPQWILPLGVLAELNPADRSFRLLEPAVSSREASSHS